MSSRLATLVAGFLVVVLVIGAFLSLLPDREVDRPKSVLSRSPWGRAVLFDMLRELDFEVHTFSDAPSQLPREGGVLVLEGLRESPLGTSPAREEGDAPSALDPGHYLAFAESGGTLVMPLDEDILDRWGSELDLPSLATDSEPDAEGPLELQLLGGELLTVDWRPAARFERLPEGASVVAADEEGHPLVVRVPHGTGALVLVADEVDFLDNARIESEDNALLAVRLVERFAQPEATVWFDEYALGGWTPASELDLAFAPRALPLTVHVLLLLALLLWLSGWVREFPRDPEPVVALSADLRAQGFANLLRRTRRWDLGARLLQRALFERLSARLGLSAPASEAGRSRNLEVPSVEDVHSVLVALAPEADPETMERGARLFTRRVENETELEELARELERLEERLEPARGGGA